MKQLQEILRPLLTEFRASGKTTEVSELWGGSKALLLLELFRESRRPLHILTATEEEADLLADDLRFFVDILPDSGETPSKPEILTFPAWSVLPFEADSPDSGTVGERMRFLYHLTTSGRGIYIASVHALMQKLPPWELFADSVKTITAGQQLDPDVSSNALAACGYEHASLVTRVGEFSRRGGIIDFFSPAQKHPVRMEFFGDTIESLRLFDPETQRSMGEITQAVALPVRELIVSPVRNAKCGVRSEGQDTSDVYLSARHVRDEVCKQIEEGSFPPGAEFLAPFFYTMEDLFRYLPDEALCVLIEPDDIKKQADSFFAGIEQGRGEETAEGRILPAASEFYLDHDGIITRLAKFPRMNLGLLGADPEGRRMDTKSSSWLGVRLRPKHALGHGDASPENAEGTASGLAEKLKRLRGTNRVLLVCGTDESAERLQRMFGEYGVPLTRRATIDLDDDEPLPVVVMTGRLSAGFAWRDLSLVVITDEEIFGSKVHRPRPARSKAAPFLSSFKELKPGDFVVHTDYGVGEYQGLTHITVDGFETDFLTLRYEPDAKLHVPLSALDKVQKYIGAEGAQPKVDRLGAPTWARTKERVKKDILQMAQELVKIYAAREAMHRTPLGPPDNLYREFEAAFPYEETPDQEAAIEDVLGDMQKERPMDRLVCGDVGFGKTEVALRAAFKAVEDGYQAAVIVPTTLLADQHFRTFSERVAPFSIRVDMMSRFRRAAEQKETLKGMKSGTVDIVIGTHRLLQRDIAFKNLGLLVIDEEHRFGVKHKERIK
jgi:transcription-repair coupling factor (superfamily II helicase)